MDPSEELIIHSQGEECYVEVRDSDSLTEVRRLILEEFDDEMIPRKDDGTEDFAFKVNGRYIQAKQECKKCVTDLKQAKIEMVAKHHPRSQNKRKTPPIAENQLTTLTNKRVRQQESTVITPCTATVTGPEQNENLELSPVLLETKLAQPESNEAVKTPTKENDANTYVQSEDKATPQATSNSPNHEPLVNVDLPEDDEQSKEVDSCGCTVEELPDEPPATSEYDRKRWLCDFEDDEDNDDDDCNFPADGEDSISADGCDNDKEQLKGQSVKDVDQHGSDSGDGTNSTSNTANNSGSEAVDHVMDDDSLVNGETETPLDTTDVQDTNPHKEVDEAKEKSQQVLDQLSNMLTTQHDFCNEARRLEWLDEINSLSKQGAPSTVFGVLGNTGVGKSSLLNALLDEAAVLPTSGSRGCTATVVELVFHSALRGSNRPAPGDANATEEASVPVYQGEVEFITLDDWTKELKLLVDECSTQEKTVYARVPEEDNMKEAHAAWQKIEQVYGNGYMEQFCRQPTQEAFRRLALHPRICELLTPTQPGKEYRTIVVEEGSAIPSTPEAEELLKPFADKSRKIQRKQKQWAQAFRSKINSYVYRKGNGQQPQTWPLIRKVQLRGPWNVLSTGACLVDLPGVRDSNAARAKVAERYLQNCNQIAIVAPIKRAVDDGTAKELLGEQFKRRLLMDGQYGNVFFICTQTDDLEASETMRDHADVAQQVEGRWEKMTDLADGISALEKQIHDTMQAEEDLAEQLQEAKQEYKEAKEELREAEKENAEEKDKDDVEVLEDLQKALATKKECLVKARKALTEHRQKHSQDMKKDKQLCSNFQRTLKSICANVRNEYSKSCLQEDFRSGLKELYRKDDDDGDQRTEDVALPEEIDMDVYCISANDYLKLMNIKTSRDGPPNTFSQPQDTQIPQLRNYVHQVTSRFCKSHAKTFVENTNDILDRMKLVASDSSNVPTGRSAYRMKNAFETEMNKLDAPIQSIANSFQRDLDQKIQQSLMYSLEKGAEKGSAVALSTVQSWGSKFRRTKHDRRPEQNGLYWGTYQATIRRSGVFNSPSAGPVDFNQELCDPMEREFSTDWQSVFDATTRRLLGEAEKTILQKCTEASQSLGSSFRSSGVEANRLSSMLNSANRSTLTALKVAFQHMLTTAQESQRDLSRTLLPAVQTQMQSTYESVGMVPGGPGVFSRMKGSMVTNSQRAVSGMFDDAKRAMLSGIDAVTKNLKAMLLSTIGIMKKTMENVFSICWDDQTLQVAVLSPLMQKRIRDCRDACLPQLNKLLGVQAEACDLLGIDREEVDLDVMGVETLEQTLERRLEEAKKLGNVLDLSDPNAEMPPAAAPSSLYRNCAPVKMEAGVGVTTGTTVRPTPNASGAATFMKTSSVHQRAIAIIDLCDSDDDWEAPPMSGLTRTPHPISNVKNESC